MPEPQLPVGFAITLDPATIHVEPDVLVGGEPLRLVRLSERGRTALEALRTGPIADDAAGVLARRLTDAGLAHPVPPVAIDPEAMTVVIPVFDRPAALDQCLTVLGDTLPVLVVDDGSTDAASIAAVTARHGARLVRLPDNRGPAAARNVGIACATTSLVALVDSDTLPTAEDLRALARYLLDPAVAAVAPRIRSATGPSLRRSSADRYARARCVLDLGTRPAAVRPYTAVPYVPTATLVAQREELLAHRFDETLRVGEDVDVIWRLLAAGKRIRYAPEVTVAHQEPRGWPKLLARRFRYGTSAAPLSRRHPSNVAPFVVHPAFTAAVLAAVTGRVRTGVALAAVSLTQIDRMVRRSGLPRRRGLIGAAQGLNRTYLGLGRWLTQCGGPVLFFVTLHARGRARLASGVLLTGAVLAARPHHRDGAPLPTFILGVLADEMAYGAGVIAGCLRERTARPLLPKLTCLEIKR